MPHHRHSAALGHAAQSAAAQGSAAQGTPSETGSAQPHCLAMPLGLRARWAAAQRAALGVLTQRAGPARALLHQSP